MVFAKDNTSTVILTRQRNLVSYYLSKWFVILPKKSEAMNYVPIEVKHCINVIEMHKNYSLMNLTTVISSVANTLKTSSWIIFLLLNLNWNYFKTQKYLFTISSESTQRRLSRIFTILHQWMSISLIWTIQNMKATWKYVLTYLLKKCTWLSCRKKIGRKKLLVHQGVLSFMELCCMQCMKWSTQKRTYFNICWIFVICFI